MRQEGNAMWCVHKHISLGLVHGSETAQKIDREGSNISMATRQEANEMFSNIAAAEEHITKEIIPKLQSKGATDKARILSQLADDLRNSRQQLAQSNIFFLNDEMKVPDNIDTILDESVSKLESLLKRADEFAPMMEQEQIRCPRCEEDARAIANMFTEPNVDTPYTEKQVIEDVQVHESSRKFTGDFSPKEMIRNVPKPTEIFRDVLSIVKDLRPTRR